MGRAVYDICEGSQIDVFTLTLRPDTLVKTVAHNASVKYKEHHFHSLSVGNSALLCVPWKAH